MKQKLRNLGLNRIVENGVKYQQSTFNNVQFEATLDYLVAKLFFIDIRNLIYTKSVLLKNFRLLPSEVDRMYYWEYEYLIEDLNKQVKEENDNQQAQLDHANTTSMSKPNVQIPKLPDVGQFNRSLAQLNKNF